MAHGHKGIREFTGEEVSNLTMGQSGFDVLTGSTTLASAKGISYWVAIKAVNADADVKASSLTPGADFATNGVYATGSALTIEDGDIVYGAFDAIIVSSGHVLAYRGRE